MDNAIRQLACAVMLQATKDFVDMPHKNAIPFLRTCVQRGCKISHKAHQLLLPSNLKRIQTKL